MPRIVSNLCFAVAAVVATPALAADYVLDVGPGTTSTDFGATASGSGTLNDRYFFTVPDGSASGFVGSIALSALLDVDLDDVRLDDMQFTQLASDGIELWTLDITQIAAGTHFIQVIGSWGETGGSYAGTLNFAPSAIPEPASWAMMIGGIGLVGGALRRRSAVRTRVTFA